MKIFTRESVVERMRKRDREEEEEYRRVWVVMNASICGSGTIEMQTTQPVDPEFIVSAWPLANYYGVNSIGPVPAGTSAKCTVLRVHT